MKKTTYLDDPWKVTEVLEEYFCVMACDCEIRKCEEPGADECKLRFTNAMLADLQKAFEYEAKQ